mgnify:CR=1 FL=1
MSLKNTDDCYGNVHQFLHWAIFLFFVGLIVVGNLMTGMEDGDDKWRLYGLHKSFGLTVFLLILLRIGWRFINIAPALPTQMPQHEKTLAILVHLALYAVMLLMPISGYIDSVAGGHKLNYFGLFDVPRLLEKNKELAILAETIHEFTAYLIYALVSLHVVGALKHHFTHKDNTLRRMLPGYRQNPGQ